MLRIASFLKRKAFQLFQGRGREKMAVATGTMRQC